MNGRLGLLAGTALGALFLIGCEGMPGTAGPAGQAGPAGETGPMGPMGPIGQDLNANCTQCHSRDTDLKAKQVQYQASTHAIGGNFDGARSATCAGCHSHEGFLERIATGEPAPAAAPENPTPPSCRTCHQIHTTYTDADFAFTTLAPVDLWMGGSVDLVGTGNLCAQCHQARIDDTMPVLGGPDVTFTSTNWGPHNGPQANILVGDTPWEFTGSKRIIKGPHRHGQAGCPRCHMATPYGDQAGGHTWNMTYEQDGTVYDNTAGCNTCHSSVDSFERADVQASVEVQLAELLGLLTTAGMYDPVEMEVIPGTVSSTLGAAWWNYEMVREDGSRGIHNPQYVSFLLANTIQAMEQAVGAPVAESTVSWSSLR